MYICTVYKGYIVHVYKAVLVYIVLVEELTWMVRCATGTRTYVMYIVLVHSSTTPYEHETYR